MHLKLIQKKQFKKTAEATGDLIRSKITYKITSVSSTSPQNTSKTLPNEIEDKIPKEKCVSPKKIVN